MSLRSTVVQYRQEEFSALLRIKRSRLTIAKQLRAPVAVSRTLARFMIRCADRRGLVPAIGTFEMQLVDPWTDSPSVLGHLRCWVDVRPGHQQVLRRMRLHPCQRSVVIPVPADNPVALDWVSSGSSPCCTRGQNH